MYAMQRQVGGEHYSSQVIQLHEFTMANGWDAAGHSLLKYVIRHDRKGGRVDLEKARHMIELRDELTRDPKGFRRGFQVLNSLIVAVVGYSPLEKEDPRIPMSVFIRANRIAEPEADFLMLLEQWIKHDPTNFSSRAHYVQVMLKTMDDLISLRYGEKTA